MPLKALTFIPPRDSKVSRSRYIAAVKQQNYTSCLMRIVEKTSQAFFKLNYYKKRPRPNWRGTTSICLSLFFKWRDYGKTSTTKLLLLWNAFLFLSHDLFKVPQNKMRSTTQDIRLTCVPVSIFYKSLVQKHVVLSSVSTASFLEKNEKYWSWLPPWPALAFSSSLSLWSRNSVVGSNWVTGTAPVIFVFHQISEGRSATIWSIYLDIKYHIIFLQ